MTVREEFEQEYGETEGVHFVPELNVYGCRLYANKNQADRKTHAWYYWQRAYVAGFRAAGEVEGNEGRIRGCIREEIRQKTPELG